MRKMGRPAKKDMKELVAAALVSAIPVTEPVDPNSLRGHESNIVRSGLAEIVCTLVFAGHSNVAIARKMGVGIDSLDRFIRSPYFQHLYSSKKEALLNAVDDMSRERVQEILMQAIEKKYDIMMDPRTSRGLADKIATDFIQMGERMLKTGKGRLSDNLKAIFEQTMTRRNEHGGETTITARIVGPAQEVAEATRDIRDSHDTGAGGESVGTVYPGGPTDRAAGASEGSRVALAPWDRREDGSGGVQSVIPPSGDGAGDVAAPSIPEKPGE